MRLGNYDDDNAILRRAYTRSMPSLRRSLSQLQESMNDVKMQLDSILNKYSERVETLLNTEMKALLCRMERIASQLKAIRQELVPLLNCRTFPVSSGGEFFQQNGILATTYTNNTNTNNNNNTNNTTEMSEWRELIQFAEDVYVWSVCMATLLNDLDSLSSSLSYISTCNLFFNDASNHNMTSRNASAFFFGSESTLGNCYLTDKEVLLICELLYHLYTRNDTAAEVLMLRVEESLLKDSKEMSELPDDNRECERDNNNNNNNNNNNVFDIITRMANWVTTQDYGELNAFLSRSFTTQNSETSFLLPPLILLFIQVMNNRVVNRQLHHSNFQNVWRPVIDVNPPSSSSTTTTTTTTTTMENIETREIDTFPSSWLNSTEMRRLAVCIMLQRESLLSESRAWPLPPALSNYCFRLSFNEQR